MGKCPGCSLTFPTLDLLQCGKCSKKDDAGSQTDRDVIDKQAQCSGCGVVYQWLHGILCGACQVRSETEPDIFTDNLRITNFLTNRVKSFDGEASKHRLNQHPQNSALQSAAKVKEKLSILKKQNKSGGVDVSVQLWIYPEIKSGTAKKAQLPSLPAQFDGSGSADNMFDELMGKVQVAYDRCPAYIAQVSPNAKPSFERKHIVFGIQKGTAVNCIDESYLIGTVAEFFSRIKTDNLLSETDAKHHKIQLRMFVYPSILQYVEVADSDDEVTFPLSTMRKLPPTPKKLKRKPDTAFGQNISPPNSRLLSSRASKIRATSPPRLLSSRTSKIRTASKFRISVVRSSANAPPYVSAYRRSTSTITYDSYQFLATTCEVSASGIPCFIKSDTTKTILIGQNWQSNVKGGERMGAYLSKGFTKVAFQGRCNANDLAIFQCQSSRGYTKDLNRTDLNDELLLLGQGQYFLDTFYKRADSFGVKDLPQIRWNFTGSFIGCATGIAPAPDSGTVDNRSLIFDYFLASPLLDINDKTTERKFSGNEDVGHNTDPLGRVIDAYIHHALVDSLGDILFADVQGVVFEDKSLCLFDPQAHTPTAESGHWDKGISQIIAYRAQHKCNSICRSLQLDKSVQESEKISKFAHPLRFGF